ncbi:nucleoporin-interacting protein NIC96 [Mycena amicta]|nr:nucleoporin-interacting protein NIC96 [Mycena amicta]
MVSELCLLPPQELTSHLSRPELPSINLSLDQIEAQSRHLVSRQPAGSNETDRANAQAHVDASALSSSIAHLNTAATFSPLQPLQDTDVAGYLRHAHEQKSHINHRGGRRDWEAKKKHVFDELGARVGGENKAMTELKKSFHGKSLASSITPSLTLQMQSKMMTYDRVITELNAARLHGTSYPIPRSAQMSHNFHVLAKITGEPPALPPVEHASAHILNAPTLERKHAQVYLGNQETREAASLRRQIANGAREALEEQYWDVLERTIQSRPSEAQLGGDPSIANKVRAFLFLRYYKNGEWEERIEQAIEHHEASFLGHFQTWLESPERRLPKPNRDHLQSIYNAHMLHSSTADPFKLALYKLLGKLEPSRRSVPHATSTTEDWLWFQLAMVDEDEDGGLRGLSEVLLGYGERQFKGPPNQQGAKQGVWAGVLLMCGQFERAVAALWEHQETEIEAGHLAIALAYHWLFAQTHQVLSNVLQCRFRPPRLLSTLIWRYARQLVMMDAKEVLQYVYWVGLAADQGPVGQEQVENAWELVRCIIVLGNSGPGWEELVGGFRADGTRFSSVINQGTSLLGLRDTKEFNEHILVKAARNSEENDRIPEAIKLYNLAGEYGTVISCLAQALRKTIAKPSADEKARTVEQTAAEILWNYERTNRAVGRDRDAVICLLRIREAIEAKQAGQPEVALEKITRKAEEFKELHEALQRNLQTYLPMTMDALAGVHQR